MKYDSHLNIFKITIPNGELLYAPHFFNQKICKRAIAYFLENENGLDWKTTDWRTLEKEQLSNVHFKNIQWKHEQIRMFGKRIFQPRYTAWYGDKDATYTYSGLKMSPLPWNEGLLFIKKQVDDLAGVSFNSVLMNWYRDGEDYMGWHADDEKELGQNPTIASVNFGATRRFLLRKKDSKTEKIELPLKDGTVLLMKGGIQHHWQHTVPKERKVKTDRFNLTFRKIQINNIHQTK